MIIPGDMTCNLQVPDVVVFNKPFIYILCHLYGDWLLPENCPLLPAGNIWGLSGIRLHRMTLHQNPLSDDLKCDVCCTIWMEQKMMSCGRKVMKKVLCVVMNVLAVA